MQNQGPCMQMRCGGCGNETFLVFADRGHRISVLKVECTRCHSISVLTPEISQIEVGWGENADGVLAIFPDEKNYR